MTIYRCEDLSELRFQQADLTHFNQLALMRWDMRIEGGEAEVEPKSAFLDACSTFYAESSESGLHHHWIATTNEIVVATISIHLVNMLPRPGKIIDRYGCITNNYTRPSYRQQGVASKLLSKVGSWARDEDYELLIVWPSELAVTLYQRQGFQWENEIMELRLREYALGAQIIL